MASTLPGKPQPGFLQRHLGLPPEEFAALPPDRRAAAAGPAAPDLHFFLDEDRPFEERAEPPRTRDLARSLLDVLAGHLPPDEPAAARALAQRVVTDGRLRRECSHDQNVYLGRLFTRTLTRAVPDLLFLPASGREVADALRWAHKRGVPVTLRGAASTAMGGAVPGDAGLALDLSRLDAIELRPGRRSVRIGAGVRMRPLHAALRREGLALPVYPSNLGGTWAGWWATGGIGLNAWSGGRARDHVLAASLVLVGGERVRLQADGSVEADGVEGTLDADTAAAWFAERGRPPLALADLAGSEGQLGVVCELELAVRPLDDVAPFLLAFETREQGLAAVDWLGRRVREGLPAPGDVKLLSTSHLEHARAVWAEEDAKAWRSRTSGLSDGGELPWRAVLAPGRLGAVVDAATGPIEGGAFLFVSFDGEEAGRAFAAALADCPGAPRVRDTESVRLAGDRFRPQQIKRLGPGYLAAEILLPSARVAGFLPEAERLAERLGLELDAEVYYLADGGALAIAGYLTDHRKKAFHVELLLAPALLDLAMAHFEGAPYVLGRWQAALFARKFGHAEAGRLRALKRGLDPDRVLGRGAFFSMGLRTVLAPLVRWGMGPGIRLFRLAAGSAPGLVRALERLVPLPAPAAGRGASLAESPLGDATDLPAEAATGRALSCINCGECNSVCPIFHESQVRLPQMLTHLGEGLHAGEAVDASGSTLLDLCMRCGNCEEVCQSGIPHLPLYGALQVASDAARPHDRERHVLLLERLRGSPRYAQDFLDVRPGGYLARAQVALPGSARYVLLRAAGDSGPAATCIHCAACVDVCPTNANREYEGEDPRLITTVQERCIGCGTCVEVCPANQRNGGQTLRVFEAPTPDLFHALREFAAHETGGTA